MHLFTEHNLLPPQNNQADYAFGTDSNNPTNKFNITSRFQLTAPAKAFACQDSLMIVQQSSVDSSLVNVILKPIEGLKIPFKSIKYFVYRGLLKDSFIDGTAIMPKSVSNTETIARIWETWENYNAGSSQPLGEPTTQCFGYDISLADTLNIENIYDNSQENVRALFVKEGEWIGNFGSTFEIGLEIITEDDILTLDLDFLRAEKIQIDVTSLSGLALRAEREKILSFIDPAAFLGLHYDDGIKISTYSGAVKTTEKKKKDDLYTLIISKFDNKNCVYLDIRSEKGYSYNFYQNYADNSGNNIKIGNSSVTPIAQTYEYSNWPIVVIDTPLATTDNKNDIKINLRIDDNTKPILFFENTDLLKGDHNPRFISETKILSGTEWSKDLSFVFPNTGAGSNKENVAYYINLNYFRQEHSPSSPNTVLQNETYFDSIFCPIDLPLLAKADYIFQQVYNPGLNFVRGQLPSINKDFGYIADSGAHWDNNRVLFYSKAIFPNKNTGQFFPEVPKKSTAITGFCLNGSFQKLSFIARDIALTFQTIYQSTGGSNYEEIKIMDITNYNGFPASKENFISLGITQNELNTLKNTGILNGVSAFSDKHHRYIFMEEVVGSPLNDINGTPYRKYKLKVQGLKNNGERLIFSPSENTPTAMQDIYVYSKEGRIFASKDFAVQEPECDNPILYQRNYEENIGYENKHQPSNQRYEDWFIEKDLGMKTEVDGFIFALNNINTQNNPLALQQIRTLVEDSAQDIWEQAVDTVQANGNNTPDDRPLYWARNKMEVALKSYPFFKGQNNTDRDNMIKLFEEKSRNYTEVDFSQAPAGSKKILITGFDPFQLNPKFAMYGYNIETQNPSGIVALYLHGKTIQDNLGNKGFIQSAIFPVRYPDFDNGVVEDLVSQFLTGSNKVDMIMSLSLNGGFYFFDLERFAAKNRGAFHDNLNIGLEPSFFKLDKSAFKQYIGIGKEFYETTLPVEKIITSEITHNFNLNQQKFFYDQSYKISKTEGRAHVTKDNTQPNTNMDSFNVSEITRNSYEGSGGNYLSNEIFYRIARARTNANSSVRTGHFHLANTNPDLSEAPSTIAPFTLSQIITETENAIIRCLDIL